MPEEDKGTCAEGDRPPGKPLFIEAQGQQSKRRPRGVYWLPNLLTTASLFCGFTSIVQGMNHRFDLAPQRTLQGQRTRQKARAACGRVGIRMSQQGSTSMSQQPGSQQQGLRSSSFGIS
ncbi:MAG: hypothetical protein EBW71_01080 [Betaproteobacteria bacterium]|nr:hypothetical protein [Betaproteobacteria bacterium]